MSLPLTVLLSGALFSASLLPAQQAIQTSASPKEVAAPEAPKEPVKGATSPQADSSKDATTESSKEAKPEPPVKSEAPQPFVIGPEDVLNIQVFGEAAIGGQQDVRPDGFISLPLAGEIKAEGLTPRALADLIRDRLKAMIRDPEVNVQILRINSRKYTIQGEVRRPGTYNFGTQVTVLEALVNAQGFNDFANPRKIYILRDGKKLLFDYKAVSHGKKMEQNIPVQNGDQIFVP